MCACQLTIKILIVMFLVAPDELSGDGSAGDGSLAESDVLEILYSASMTEEDYRNFRQQQGLFVELKDFPGYLEKEILANDKISIELSTSGEPSFHKQVRLNVSPQQKIKRYKCVF